MEAIERRAFLLGMLGALTAAAGFTVTTTASAGAHFPLAADGATDANDVTAEDSQPSGPITRSSIAVTRVGLIVATIAVLLAGTIDGRGGDTTNREGPSRRIYA